MKWTPLFLVLLAVPLSGEAKAQSEDTWITAEALMWWTKNGPAPSHRTCNALVVIRYEAPPTLRSDSRRG